MSEWPMPCSDSGKISRLRAGESAPGDVAEPAGEPADHRQLRELRELDERLRVEGHEALLDERERAIIDEALGQYDINYSRIGAALGLVPSTVWRSVKRLLKRAGYLQQYAKTLLGESWAGPGMDQEIWLLFKVLLTGGKKVLSRENHLRLNSWLQGGAAARRLLHPPPNDGLTIEWRGGEKIFIRGRGPLPADLKEAVRAGKAERIFDGPPRCHACGRYLSRPSTGRPPRYCSERCRSRYRRRG